MSIYYQRLCSLTFLIKTDSDLLFNVIKSPVLRFFTYLITLHLLYYSLSLIDL